MIKAIICDIQGVLANGGINEELISFLIENKKLYGKFILHSNLGKQSVENFKNLLPKLSKIVDKTYYYKSMKYVKPDVRSFQKILDENNLKPQETIFVDDNQRNIDSANELGIRTILYENFESISTLKNLLYLESDL